MGEGLVKDAERMRKVDPPRDLDFAPLTDTPHRAGKVAEAVDRDNDCFFKRRDMECRGEMREMVLDIVECSAKAVTRKGLGEQLGNLLPPAAVPEAREHQVHFGRVAEKIADLSHAMDAVVQIDGDMVDIAE